MAKHFGWQRQAAPVKPRYRKINKWRNTKKSKESKRQTEVISPPGLPLVQQNVADVAEGKHSASAECLDGQHISSSGGSMNKRCSGK